MEMAEIQEYWQNAAKIPIDKDGLRPSARDPYLQAAVETAIERHLKPDDVLYDFGCGDGLSTLRFARSVKRAEGYDYIEDYVLASRYEGHGVKNVNFHKADVTDLRSMVSNQQPCNVAVTIRCLINLPTWDLQAQAIEQISRTIMGSGLYILSEGWQEGWDGLNIARAKLGIEPMSLVPYNRLMKRAEFEAEASKYFNIVAYENLGFYIFMSRVLQPAFVKPNQPKHTHDLNRIAESMLALDIGRDAFKDVDYAGVYVLKRK